MDFSNLPKTIESIDKLSEVINVSTSDDEVLEASFYLAQIYYELKQYDEAIKVLVKNINNDNKITFNEFICFNDFIIRYLINILSCSAVGMN